MAISDKIKALMKLAGKNNDELAAYLGLKSTQALHNKFSRGSFSAEDLIKIADFLDCDLNFDNRHGTRISLDKADIRQ